MRIMWRRFILAVLVCGMSVPLGAAPTGARDQRAAASSTARASAVSHRYVVLLDGIDSYDRPFAVSRARVGTTPADHAVVNDFAVVRAGILGTLPHAHIVYFSYAIGPAVDGHGNPALAWAPCVAVPATPNCRDSQSLPRRMFQEPSYKQDDTKNFDLRTHADGLNWLLNRIIKEDPQAEIDLVGFSLGGIVASLWAAKDAPTSSAAVHVHALTLIESPVGGFALANQVFQSCGLDPICQLWFGGHGILATMIGKPVLRDLQLANQGAKGTLSYPKGSIVGTLAKNVTPRFDVTAIQSRGDYLVNGASLPLCNHACTQVVRVVIGAGVQSWSPPVMELHGSALLGGHAVTAAYANVRAAVQFLLPNHHAPLRDGQTATWVAQALKSDGPHWVKYRPTSAPKPKILPVIWRTMYIAATAQGGTKVNLRAGPGTSYPIIEQIPNGTAVQADAVPIKGQGGALWYKVSYGGKSGYVLAELLSLKKSAPVSTPSTQGGAPTRQSSRFSAHWISRPSGTIQTLEGISCPTVNKCVATGLDIILTSTDGGATWTSAHTWTAPAGTLGAIGLESVSCPSSSMCVTGGEEVYQVAPGLEGIRGTILTSMDGGGTWVTRLTYAGDRQYAFDSISCPSTRNCVATGAYGIIFTSEDGGSTWMSRTSGTSAALNVSCPSMSTCVAVGGAGTILTSADGGASWTPRTSGTNAFLSRVTCSSSGRCIAVGGTDGEDVNRAILTSADGGITWTTRLSDKDWSPYGVACPSVNLCVTVGEAGTMLTSTDRGVTWNSLRAVQDDNLYGISCPSALDCVAVGDNGRILQWRG